MKFTDGPWDIAEGHGDDGSWEAYIYQGESGTICRIDDEMVDHKGNARLITVAPEMYALINAAIELRKVEEKSGDVVNWPKWFEEAKKLINLV